MKTRVITGSESLENVLKGAEILYEAVSTTMGPRGNNVVFKKNGGRTGVTHDGVTVAKMVDVNDPAQAVAADLLREAASKQDATTGDGTTTVTVLAYHILKEAAKYVEKGENPMKLKLAIEEAEKEVLSLIDDNTKKDVTIEDLIAVASIAAGDKEIGKDVATALFEAGKDTPIMLGFSDEERTYIESINGFKIESGSASPYLLDGMKTEIDNPKIIVVDGHLRDKDEIVPILRVISSLDPSERAFLLVAKDVSHDALQLLTVNRLKGFANLGAVRVPSHINSPTEYLADVAASTGATVLTRNTANSYMEPSVEQLGSARKVVIETLETVIIDGQFAPEDMERHIASLKTAKETSKNSALTKFIDDRLKTLGQKALSIRVGGQSDTDAEEKHYRYEDAVGASRAALRSGTVPGGGTLLYEAAKLSTNPILNVALKQPLMKILSNAGIQFDNWIELGKGFDVMHPEDGIVDLRERGVIDPAESEIECVKTAITIAGLLITSGAIIVDEGTKNETQIS